MTPINFKSANMFPGAPENWDPASHGPCAVLPVQAAQEGGLPGMYSLWRPSADEVIALMGGGAIRLGIVGTAQHPVVNLGVVDPATVMREEVT